jgi:hypothetical protein
MIASRCHWPLLSMNALPNRRGEDVGLELSITGD